LYVISHLFACNKRFHLLSSCPTLESVDTWRTLILTLFTMAMQCETGADPIGSLVKSVEVKFICNSNQPEARQDDSPTEKGEDRGTRRRRMKGGVEESVIQAVIVAASKYKLLFSVGHTLSVFHFAFALPVNAIAVIAVIALNALAPTHTHKHT